jgi:cell division protein FtsW
MKVLIAPSMDNAGKYANKSVWPRKQAMSMDYILLGVSLTLLAIGLVMVGSASVSIAEKQMGEPFYYFQRQCAYALAGLLLAWGVLHIKIEVWEKVNPKLLIFGVLSLLLVLLAGKEVNGSLRWISLGVVNIQPSEFMKLFVVLYLAGYLVRRGDEVCSSVKGFLKPMILMSLVGILLLLEPDFGSAFVIAMTAMGMMFIGGVQVRQFGILFLLMAVGFGIVAYASPYRVERLTCFLNPWANPFDCGFQLTQSLIAFGRGEWFGVGLGGSIQKLFYLPEAHTDFLFAVLAEELGLLGGLFVISLFATLVWRAFSIGQSAFRAQQRFAGYVAYGLGLLIGLQAFINIGVNMGLLPTKGLTLPLMSYGGSSVVATCIGCAVLLRISHEYPSNVDSNARSGRFSRS